MTGRFESHPEYDLWWALSDKAGLRTMRIVKAAGGSERLFLMERDELLGLEGVSDKWILKTVWGVGYKFEVL